MARTETRAVKVILDPDAMRLGSRQTDTSRLDGESERRKMKTREENKEGDEKDENKAIHK
jgi:hypothetical protein